MSARFGSWRPIPAGGDKLPTRGLWRVLGALRSSQHVRPARAAIWRTIRDATPADATLLELLEASGALE